MTKIIGITGWSGSGKTSLIVRLIPELTKRGLSIATVKHAHHEFDIDKPSKDSYQHRMAGATEVVVSSARRWAIIHENRDDPEPSLEEILAKISPVDIVLVEGYKTESHFKIEVHRQTTDQDLICRQNNTIVAVASDARITGLNIPVIDLNDTAMVAEFIAAQFGIWTQLEGAI
jgi:molybdopterin-guanine dinucleotide biosynthesis protein B